MSFFNIQAKERRPLTKELLNDLNFNEMQTMRTNYIRFMIQVEKKSKYSKKPISESYSSYNPYFKFLEDIGVLAQAYAQMADGEKCFFGGWPSKIKDGLCDYPWEYRDDADIDPKYKRDLYCGSKSDVPQIRCNPTLFGAPVEGVQATENGVNLNLNPRTGAEKGYCVEVGDSYAELSQKCEKASRKSIPSIIDGLMNDPTKQQELVDLDKQVKDFCAKWSGANPKEYDACDDIDKRIKDLLAGVEQREKEQQENPDRQGQDPTGGTGQAASVGEVFKECDNYLKRKSSDDDYARNILGNIQERAGVCSDDDVDSTLEPFVEDDLEEISDQINKQEALMELNLLSFESIIHGLWAMNESFLYPQDDWDNEGYRFNNKTELWQQLTKEHPRTLSDPAYKEKFEEVYAKLEEYKKVNPNGFPKLDHNALLKEFRFGGGDPAKDPEPSEISARSINKVCQDIHEEFYEKFKHKKENGLWGMGSWTEFARPYSDEENTYLASYNHKMKGMIGGLFKNSRMGSLLATEKFKDYVVDVDQDFAKECVQNPAYSVIRSERIPKRVLREALAEARLSILDGVGDLRSGGFWDFAKNDFSTQDHIDEYLKGDQSTVALALLRKGTPEEKEKYAKYICYRTQQIYDADEVTGFGMKVVGGGATILGTVLTFTPLSPLGVAIASKGAIMLAGSGAIEMIDSQLTDSRLENVLARDIGTHGMNYIEQHRSNENKFRSGAITTSTAALGPVISRGTNLLRSGNTVDDAANVGAQTSDDVVNAGTQTADDVVNAGTQTADDVVNAGAQTADDISNAGMQSGNELVIRQAEQAKRALPGSQTQSLNSGTTFSSVDDIYQNGHVQIVNGSGDIIRTVPAKTVIDAANLAQTNTTLVNQGGRLVMSQDDLAKLMSDAGRSLNSGKGASINLRGTTNFSATGDDFGVEGLRITNGKNPLGQKFDPKTYQGPQAASSTLTLTRDGVTSVDDIAQAVRSATGQVKQPQAQTFVRTPGKKNGKPGASRYRETVTRGKRAGTAPQIKTARSSASATTPIYSKDVYENARLSLKGILVLGTPVTLGGVYGVVVKKEQLSEGNIQELKFNSQALKDFGEKSGLNYAFLPSQILLEGKKIEESSIDELNKYFGQIIGTFSEDEAFVKERIEAFRSTLMKARETPEHHERAIYELILFDLLLERLSEAGS